MFAQPMRQDSALALIQVGLDAPLEQAQRLARLGRKPSAASPTHAGTAAGHGFSKALATNQSRQLFIVPWTPKLERSSLIIV